MATVGTRSQSTPLQTAGQPETIAAPLLSVRKLTVSIRTRRGILTALDEVSFDVARGEVLGIVGESGAGKSLTGQAIIGLLEPPVAISGGEILLDGSRIDDLPRDRLKKIRGRRIGMVFQDPLTSLNPLYRIGDQLTETITTHLGLDQREAWTRAVSLLEEVGLPAASARMAAYPHELSGGMRQRVVIALALAGEPDLVIADEPTTALDVSIQAQVINVLKRACAERGASVVLITHDMGVIATMANRVAVMYAGRVAEIGPVRSVVRRPAHPYTIGLMGTIPSLHHDVESLLQIPGSMPRLASIPSGCAFYPRCRHAFERCVKARPELMRTASETWAACWLWDEQEQHRRHEALGAEAGSPHEETA